MNQSSEEKARIMEEVREIMDRIDKSARRGMRGEDVPQELIEELKDKSTDVNILLDIVEGTEQ